MCKCHVLGELQEQVIGFIPVLSIYLHFSIPPHGKEHPSHPAVCLCWQCPC